MKTTINLPLSFECQYEILANNICFFEINVLNNPFSTLKERYIGIGHTVFLDKFLSDPNVKNLMNLNKLTEHGNGVIISTKLIQKLHEKQDDLSSYLLQTQNLKDLIKNNTYYQNIINDLLNGTNQIVFPYTHQKFNKPYLLLDLNWNAIYMSNYLTLHDDKDFFVSKYSYSLLNPENQNIVNFPLIDNQKINYLTFFNKMIAVQNKNSIFTKDSFYNFLSQYTNNPNMALFRGSIKKSNFKLKPKEETACFPSIIIKDQSHYDICYKAAYEINEITTDKNKLEEEDIANILLLQKNNIFKDLDINFNVFCEHYFTSTFQVKHTISLINNYFLKKELEENMPISSLVKRNKI